MSKSGKCAKSKNSKNRKLASTLRNPLSVSLRLTAPPGGPSDGAIHLKDFLRSFKKHAAPPTCKKGLVRQRAVSYVPSLYKLRICSFRNFDLLALNDKRWERLFAKMMNILYQTLDESILNARRQPDWRQKMYRLSNHLIDRC